MIRLKARSRRWGAWGIGFALGLALGASACTREEPARPAPRPPNILLLTIDTLRADHLSAYGYPRKTSPRIDALAREGVLFERAYTFWPKTRASFVMIHTGLRASQNGYGPSRPVLLAFNATLATLLKGAGYSTAAIVDNANISAQLGYSKGFDTYEQVWENPVVKTEVEGARAITRGAVRFLQSAPADRSFLLWLHYVNPHAPYTPPKPYDTAFLDGDALSGPRLRVVSGYHGGIPRPLYVSGHRQVAYYVAEYDGEIATVDGEVGEVLEALRGSKASGRTVVLLTSDHGESLGEHDYYFDHGEDVFDPCLRIPLVLVVPGGPAARRSDALASTLDIVPTLLEAAGVPRPPGLAGESLLPVAAGGRPPRRDRLFAQNDRGLTATWDERFKLVAGPGGASEALYDRLEDPGETRDVSRSHPAELHAARAQMDYFLARSNQERAQVRRFVESAPLTTALPRDACERLKALGYVQQECPP